MTKIAKPQPGMFKPFSGAYISLADDNIELTELKTEFEKMKAFLLSIPADKLEYRYAEGQVDAERNACTHDRYRANF